MIKLVRSSAPTQLSTAIVAQKVAQYKATGDAVWKEPYITRALMAMSHDKCCYCECNISEESKYLEVEHFHDKKRYPDEVVNWDNLLPSCKRCNSKKGRHDTVAEPMIDPAKEDPREHMILLRGTIFRPRDEKGRTTIEVLFLNDPKRLAPERFTISAELAEKVEELRARAGNLRAGISSGGVFERKLINGVTDLLQSCCPTESFSAVKATVVLSDPLFSELEADMRTMNIWTEEMDELKQAMLDCQYSVA